MSNLVDSLFCLHFKGTDLFYELTPPRMVSDSGFRIEHPVKCIVEHLIKKLVMG